MVTKHDLDYMACSRRDAVQSGHSDLAVIYDHLLTLALAVRELEKRFDEAVRLAGGG